MHVLRSAGMMQRKGSATDLLSKLGMHGAHIRRSVYDRVAQRD